MSSPQPQRAHRVPVLWLVAGLPLATVAAGFATLFIALDGPDATLPDSALRTAQVQTRDLAPDVAALVAGITGELRARRKAGEFELTIANAGQRALIRLTLRHPGDAMLDRELVLRRIGEDRFVGRGPPLAAGSWNLELRPLGGGWLLVGRLPRDVAVAALASRLAPIPVP